MSFKFSGPLKGTVSLNESSRTCMCDTVYCNIYIKNGHPAVSFNANRIESDKTTSIYNVSTRVLSKK